jgi:predicted dehydrogenase
MLHWAILGTGFISNTMVDAITASDGSQVDLIAGRNRSKVAEFQKRHCITRSSSYENALSDPNIDAVYIGLPNDQHHPFAIAAAQAGKAVLSEKSLTTTMDDAHSLVQAIRANGTFFVEGLMYLAHPVHRRFVELLSDGRLGTLRSISARYGADIAHLVNPAGRGTIYNLGCYPVSLIHLVVQTQRGPDAFANRSVSGAGIANATDGTICDAALAVRFDNQVLATVQASDSYGNTSEFSVAGDKGVLRFGTNPWLPVAGDNTIIWQPHDARPEPIVVHDRHDAFYHQIKMVEAHVAAGETEAARPSPRLSDSLEIMELLTEWERLCLAS